MKLLQSIRQSNRSIHGEFKQCKKEERNKKHDEKKEHKEEIKSQVKILRDQIKDIKHKNKSHDDDDR